MCVKISKHIYKLHFHPSLSQFRFYREFHTFVFLHVLRCGLVVSEPETSDKLFSDKNVKQFGGPGAETAKSKVSFILNVDIISVIKQFSGPVALWPCGPVALRSDGPVALWP